jgi:hypothetical protein
MGNENFSPNTEDIKRKLVEETREKVLLAAAVDADLVNKEFSDAKGGDISDIDVMHSDAVIEGGIRKDIKNSLNKSDFRHQEWLEKNQAVFDLHVEKNSSIENKWNDIKEDLDAATDLSADLLTALIGRNKITELLDNAFNSSQRSFAKVFGTLNGQTIEIILSVSKYNPDKVKDLIVKQEPAEIMRYLSCRIMEAKIDGKEVQPKEAKQLLSGYENILADRQDELKKTRLSNI